MLSFEASADTPTFKNPILTEGPDPWVYKHTDGNYYMMVTRGNRLDVWKSRSLSNIAQSTPVTLWKKPDSGPNSRDIWAPEIHFLQGKWYIYYTATDAKNPGDATRYVFVLENSSKDPLQGTWQDKGKVNTKYSGLDGSLFTHKGKLYFMYSAYVGPQSVLCIAPMQNPWTLASEEVMIAKPTFQWEKHKEREILEGPQILRGKKGTLHIVYSASACWDDNYSLGMLTASDNSNLLDPKSWQKSSSPVFSKSDVNKVFGPGHNSFTTSPDGTEDWIVYHGKDIANGECSGRSTRIQKFSWKPDGTPDFGIPLATSTPVKVPSGEKPN
ncbi:family 43 glycosylhydrolase [Rhodocytophaga rosea]|uniref:Family 43 glycosylhydrolase n=2 Tax=Rhodocytophaga rosea TaxID=2704465 RepID=A0A6C0GXM1_9BACT|nr:family 43 glycosylhydrolase [Rhodocytophaga rosea]